MFEKEGVVSKKHKASKMFASPSHDVMTTGHYNVAGSDHGVGIAPRVGTPKVTSKQVIPPKSKCSKCSEYIGEYDE